MGRKIEFFGIWLLILLFCRFNATTVIVLYDVSNAEQDSPVDKNDLGSSDSDEFFIRKLNDDGVSPFQQLEETVYAHSVDGKSHRFYFTAGERQEGSCKFVQKSLKENSKKGFVAYTFAFDSFSGDKIIGQVAKELGWKNPTNTTVHIEYPGGDKKEGNELTFVLVVVYQVSIHIFRLR